MALELSGETQAMHVLPFAYMVVGELAETIGILKEIGADVLVTAIEAARADSEDERELIMLDLFQSVVGLVEVFDEGEARMTVANGEDDADASSS